MQQLFIGTYTENTESQGIYTLLLDEKTGHLTHQSHCSDCQNPSFVIQQGEWLFAAEELEDRGQVASFHIAADGRLTRISQQTVPGSLTCHLQFSAKRQVLYAANYGSGCYFGCPVSQGILGRPCVHYKDSGHGTDPVRQEGPHAHSVNLTLDENDLLVADLGIDRIFRYHPQSNGSLSPVPEQPWFSLPAGQGPRHLTFHPNGQWLYIVTELGNQVFQFTKHENFWVKIASWSTLPPHFQGENLAADIHLSPKGDRLYVSNRGADNIAVFSINPKSGSLTPKAHISSHGETPRNFALLADGHYLLTANQGSDNLVLYTLSGAQTTPIASISVPSPVCICSRQNAEN